MAVARGLPCTTACCNTKKLLPSIQIGKWQLFHVKNGNFPVVLRAMTEKLGALHSQMGNLRHGRGCDSVFCMRQAAGLRG